MGKKKGKGPSGREREEQRRQRLEERRREKTAALAARRRAQIRVRILRWAAIVGIGAFAIWFLFLRGQAPDAIAGYEVTHLSLSGAGEHTETAIEYESNPPASGPHSQSALPCGTHAKPLPDENIVHTLEHGGVGIFFHPSVPQEEIERVQRFVQSFESHVFSAPDVDMLKPFTAVAWGQMMRLDHYDEEALRGFVDEFRAGGDAPEAYQECPLTVTESSNPHVESPSPGEEEEPHIDETPHS